MIFRDVHPLARRESIAFQAVWKGLIQYDETSKIPIAYRSMCSESDFCYGWTSGLRCTAIRSRIL